MIKSLSVRLVCARQSAHDKLICIQQFYRMHAGAVQYHIYAICHSCVSSRLHTPPSQRGFSSTRGKLVHRPARKRATCFVFVALRRHTQLADCKKREREHLQGLKAAAACHSGDTEKGQRGHVISSRARTALQRNRNNRWRDAGGERASYQDPPFNYSSAPINKQINGRECVASWELWFSHSVQVFALLTAEQTSQDGRLFAAMRRETFSQHRRD